MIELIGIDFVSVLLFLIDRPEQSEQLSPKKFYQAPLSNKPFTSEPKFVISSPSYYLYQNSRIYQRLSMSSGKKIHSHVNFDMVWDKTVSNLSIWFVKLHVESAKYRLKELKSYYIYIYIHVI